jgi:hypothetical protein
VRVRQAPSAVTTAIVQNPSYFFPTSAKLPSTQNRDATAAAPRRNSLIPVTIYASSHRRQHGPPLGKFGWLSAHRLARITDYGQMGGIDPNQSRYGDSLSFNELHTTAIGIVLNFF